jgi:hypothetical protein
MMGLRVRLFLLVLIAVLPAIAIQIHTEIDLRRSREAEIHEDALRHAGTVADAMLEILEGSRQLLVALARLPPVQALNPEACSDSLGMMLAELPAYSTVGAADRAGRMICSAAGEISPPPLVSDRTYFRDALLTNGFVIGEYIVGRATGASAFPVAHPIRQSGETIGVLVASLDLNWLERHLRRRAMPDRSVVMVVDRNGTVIARLPEGGERWIGRQLPEAHRPYIFGDQSTTVELAGLDGIPRVFAYVPINFPASASASSPLGWSAATSSAGRSMPCSMRREAGSTATMQRGRHLRTGRQKSAGSATPSMKWRNGCSVSSGRRICCCARSTIAS